MVFSFFYCDDISSYLGAPNSVSDHAWNFLKVRYIVPITGFGAIYARNYILSYKLWACRSS